MKSGLFSYTISMSALSEKSRKSVEWCYALGVLGITAASGSVVCFLMFFGTAVLGLPGTLVGAAFSLSVGFPGIYLGQALSPILPALVGLIYFKSRVWERKTLVREPTRESSRNK